MQVAQYTIDTYDYKKEINNLNTRINELVKENNNLRSDVSRYKNLYEEYRDDYYYYDNHYYGDNIDITILSWEKTII